MTNKTKLGEISHKIISEFANHTFINGVQFEEVIEEEAITFFKKMLFEEPYKTTEGKTDQGEVVELYEAIGTNDRKGILDALGDIWYFGVQWYATQNEYFAIESVIALPDLQKFDDIKTPVAILRFSLMMAEAYSIRLCEVVERIHTSNLSKRENGSFIYREDGKIIKGSGYEEPKLDDLI